MLTEAVIYLKLNSVMMDLPNLPKGINGGSSLPYQQDGVSLKNRFSNQYLLFLL